MKNEKGEVVTGALVALMVLMMIFGHMGLGHGGGGGGGGGHCMSEPSEKGQQHAHDGGIEKPAQTAGEEGSEVIAVAK